MKTVPFVCALVFAAGLAGCANWKPRPVPYAAAGAELVLETALEFPADTTRIYFQRGRVVTERQLSLWDHHCALAIDHAFEQLVTIPAGRYVVADTQRRSTIGDWGYGVITYESSFILAAEAWPLYALYCEQWTLGDPYDPRQHIRLEQLDETLSDALRLMPVRAP